ncbi:MAG: nitrilase [Alphaproteobacteria bacterium]|nr:nitrilase [Alphaproteobacteria bacterium]
MGIGMTQANASGSERFSALALQTACDAVNQDKSATAARNRMKTSIGRIRQQIAASKGFLKGFNGYDLRLVVLPEYWMTGFPLGESRDEWREKAVIDLDGEIPELIAGMARALNIYLCSNHYENDPNFPDIYFQANVVYAPSGDVALRYRRMISLYSPTPYDVWDAYLKIYGEDAIFPVADSDIGRIGTVASEEILYPEVARMLGLKGAELILHPTSEVGAPGLTPKDIAKRARALENIAYVISANSGRIEGTAVPAASTDFMSKIVDWKGGVVAEAGGGETMNANAIIDLDGLRSARRQTGMSNFISRLPTAAFRSGYLETMAPTNRSPDGRMIERADAIAQQKTVIDGLVTRGVIK